jgi:neutral ceramidase
MSHRAAVYSGDLFGIAARRAEASLSTERGPTPIVAIFNGAEGDVSPDWHTQDRRDTLRLGKILAHSIVSASGNAQPIQASISNRFADSFLPDRCVATGDGKTFCTARHAAGGLSTLGGAEDARTEMHSQGCVEGLVEDDDKREHGHQYPKAISSKKRCKVPLGLPSTEVVTAFLAAPEHLPLGIHRIGPLYLLTLPGEFTTVAGLRIAQQASRALATERRNIVLVGLANEYLSYFATPEEYDLQHYEGASTLYGRGAAEVVAKDFESLASSFESPQAGSAERYTYFAGLSSHHGVRHWDDFNQPYDEGLREVMVDLSSGLIARHCPKFCWSESVASYRALSTSTEAVIPHVRVEELKVGSFRTLETSSVAADDRGEDFVTIVERFNGEQATFCAFWLRSQEPRPDTWFRFFVQSPNGDVHHSPPFSQ